MSGRPCAESAEAVRLWLAGGITKAEACRVAGVSYTTLWRTWVRMGSPEPTVTKPSRIDDAGSQY